jgi:hypothetical protein
MIESFALQNKPDIKKKKKRQNKRRGEEKYIF